MFRRPRLSLDEFVSDAGPERAASPFALGADWSTKLSKLTRCPVDASDLALSAFTLLRGGDLFEAPQSAREKEITTPALLDSYRRARLLVTANRAAADRVDALVEGIASVLHGNAALCRRMLLARPIRLVVIPKRHDFRSHGFPPNTNPHAAGIFWNAPTEEHALIGIREEWILEKPWLMVHEMAHAVHFLGMTADERDAIDRVLLPVYGHRRYVEEVVAIYAERAFGATYTDDERRSPDFYGMIRREWTERAVFARFSTELFRPLGVAS